MCKLEKKIWIQETNESEYLHNVLKTTVVSTFMFFM